MAIIVKPIVTEKMTALTDKLNRYGFKVDLNANKIQIKQAVQEMYNVTVVSVNTSVQRGKKTSRYTKGGIIKGEKSSYKKAIVTLKQGDVIDLYSNI
jgi:large subunit ribosomal protein L23